MPNYSCICQHKQFKLTRMKIFLPHLLILLPAVCLTQEPGDLVLVSPPAGPVHGRVSLLGDSTSATADEFLGIPFAEPPLGDLRFRPPQPIPAWTEVRPALQLPYSCPQLDMGFDHWFNAGNSSEDCLYLNVWRPTSLTPPNIKRSVLVWIYGGGYIIGSSTSPAYDGKILAAYRDVIVVSMQYRVNSLGFLTLGSSTTAPGNVGLLDQQLAIKWVKDNIESFGGDPDKITLFGESAGAGSVNYHLVSKDSRKYFKRAIMQSGQVTAPWASISPETAVQAALDLATSLNCPVDQSNPEATLTCLRGKDVSLIIPSPEKLTSILPISYDPNFLQSSIQDILDSGSYYKTEVLLGANRDEGTVFLGLQPPHNPQLNRTTFQLYLTSHLHQLNANDVQMDLIEYLYTDGDQPHSSEKLVYGLSQAVGDAWFVCPMSYIAQMYADDNVKTYTYFFTHRSAYNTYPEWMGVQHGDEIYYVFGVPFRPDYNSTEADKDFSRLVMTYWTNFATTGNPNTGESVSPRWEKRTAGNTECLTLTASAEDRVMSLGPNNHRCAFWNGVFPALVNATTVAVSTEQQGKYESGSRLISASYFKILRFFINYMFS